MDSLTPSSPPHVEEHVDEAPKAPGAAAHTPRRSPGNGTQSQTVDQLKRAVPEQPRLAPHVRTAGQMSESAFVDPPWLLDREGEGYIQVPRPLYRIAERADGRHTLRDLAQEVSGAEGRGISAENVRHLVATQLIPNGIVTARDGSVAPRPPTARSALAIARLKTVDPRLLVPITGALQVVYWPPVLLMVLLVTALTQAWLYMVHGVGASLHDAFYTPGFMVLVLTAIILSAGFHELGHAAALRYAGGTPRSFGFGMYLMYSVFFTDVSDNYRLRRWARVRTDLGGFYFNLIFALGVFGLYVLTRQEVLLVMIVLMNFEIIRQLLPIVRLDGYWTLADLTGIPDFFSRMGAFLRSILPLKHDAASRTLPPLKWWGKAVFLGYILTTVPALAWLSLLMLRSVPRVLATAWDALGQQGQAFLQAAAGGKLMEMAGAVGQEPPVAPARRGLVVLALPAEHRRWPLPVALERRLASASQPGLAGRSSVRRARVLPLGSADPVSRQQAEPVVSARHVPANWSK